jgi:hypothetical protein
VGKAANKIVTLIMKRLFTLLIGLTFFSCSNKITSTPTLPTFRSTETNKDLIGTWEFVEMRDNQNEKVDTIRHPIGYEIASGPLLIYNKDGTYTKKFTPRNSDEGIWTFDSRSNEIIHYLLIDSTTMIGKDLIKRQLAIKYADGNYYEKIKDKIIIKSKNEIEVFRRENLKMKYRKITTDFNKL